MDKKPLVLTEGQIEQLQTGDQLTLEEKVALNTRMIGNLTFYLVSLGFKIEDIELLNTMKNVIRG